MAGEKFYLIFSEEPNKRVRINEPINYSEVDFNLDQRDNAMGRDVSLSGGKLNFKFTIYRHGKAFEKILYYAHYYGFESDVKLIILLSTGEEFIGELDFIMAETNDFDYFDCPIIVESQMQIFRRRSETKVDLFSDVSIDGELIGSIQPANMLLQAKPSIQVSKWKQAIYSEPSFSKYVNITQYLVQSEIDNSYVPFIIGSTISDFILSDFLVLKAETNLRNVVVKMSNINITGSASVDSFSMRINVAKGIDSGNINDVTYYVMHDTPTGKNISIIGDLPELNIGDVARGECVFIYLENNQTTFAVVNKLNSIDTQISSESTAYNSITPTFRLIDVMKQVCKSISGLDVSAPRFDLGGEFYDTVLTNGNLLRNVLDKPFSISWDDIEKSLNPELNADSEIQLDKRVFYGIEEDFYTNEECGFFPNTQFSTLNRKPNLLYTINNFNYKYENYQSLKENTEPNSESTIHGQSIFTPFNKKGESSRELSIKWIRDAILLDVQQRLSTIVSKDTATQDDDKIFAIDTIATENDQQFTESTTLQQTFNGFYLSLRSNGEVNFTVLGVKIGTNFIIQYPDLNAGNYTVYEVSNTEIQLLPVGSISTTNDGIRLTKYTYEIKKETIPLTNRTNQGFDVVLNLISPEKYSNLKYSVQRNIKNYWNSYLATANLYHKDKPLKNTYYKNNGSCETLYNGLRVIEKEDWFPNNPIVTPYMYQNVIFANVEFNTFIELISEIRSRRGFIRTIDNNKRVLRLYPIKMSYKVKTRQLTFSGQEKFEKAYMTIVKKDGIITVNEETKLRTLIYSPIALQVDKQVILFDLEKQRLYNPIYWDKVSVNGAIPETIDILKEWLDLL